MSIEVRARLSKGRLAGPKRWGLPIERSEEFERWVDEWTRGEIEIATLHQR
ncbi:hypothetical protein [Rhizobium sp. NXC24]|uniref:hypothetical protein n=1 Tax=Rhizobium sp. NXC24 TaxID=2048897 RepID=UPI0018F7F4FD|nr:hypothetical protein [Rhizobium sp. NXC24]